MHQNAYQVHAISHSKDMEDLGKSLLFQQKHDQQYKSSMASWTTSTCGWLSLL